MVQEGRELIIIMERMLCELSDLVNKTLPPGVDPNKIPDEMTLILGILSGLLHLHSSGSI
jgi:hypothetical protein